MEQTKLIFADFTAALGQLKAAVSQVKDDLDRDGAIQRFEFTIELSWKVLQKILFERKVLVNSPRMTYREAYKEGLIEDPETWLDYWDVRNLTTHMYKQKVAEEIYKQLPGFVELAEELKAKLTAESGLT